MNMSPAQKKQSYLQRLKFDPALMKGLLAAYITNFRVVTLLVIAILGVGLVSYFNLPRRLNPEIKIPIVMVSTVLPGAGPADVESLITVPLENEIQGIKGIDTVTSVSRDNVSFISIQFFSSVDQDKAKDDVQAAIDSVTDLPDDAQTPRVNVLDFEDQPIWTFAVSTDSDVRSLMNYSKELRKRIDNLPQVDRVLVSGYENQDIVVEVSPIKVRELGVDPMTFSNAIQKAVASYPAGNIETQNNTFALSIDPRVTTVNDIRSLYVNIQGVNVKLGEVASVVERSRANIQPSYLATKEKEGRRVVVFSVYKTSDVNIDRAAEEVEKVVDQAQEEYNDRFEITTVLNTAEEIVKQFDDLVGEFRSTIILVFACLFLFLGLRQAIISSFTVPLTFLSAFFFMSVFGMSINFLSLFSFLLALGLLIDDTIVVVSAMTRYYRTGKFSPKETGILVWRDTIVPIWSTTITTIWSFVPLLLSTGIIGEFIKPIPIVISVTMISSTAIAVLITLPLMIVLLKPNLPRRVVILMRVLLIILGFGVIFWLASGSRLFLFALILYGVSVFVFFRVRNKLFSQGRERITKRGRTGAVAAFFARAIDRGVIDIEPLAKAYQGLIHRIILSKSARRKVIVAIVIYSVVAFLLVPLGFVKNEFFPKSDVDVLYVNVELPPGTTTERAFAESRGLLERLRHQDGVSYVVAEVGKTLDTMGGQSDAPNGILYTLHLPPEDEQKKGSIEIAQEVREKFSAYTKGTLSVIEQSGGPPAGADVQLQLLGDDLGTLNSYADKLTAFLRRQQGITSVDKSIKPGTSKLVFVPDESAMAQNNISRDMVGFWLRSYASGFTLDSINFDKSTTDKQDVVFKLSSFEQHPESLGALSIPTQSGNVVPLLSVGQLKAQPNPTFIAREGGKRSVTVSAGIEAGQSIPDKNKALLDYANSLELPAGYEWKTGGANEENQKSINSIIQAMGVAFILILVTMVVQFNSYRQAAIVLMVIPLAVSSVFIIFALTGTPLSFPALIGVLSLFGIVVTNSMFIVDKINLNQKEGMPFDEAIANAGASRMEPIILTKLCTILGLLPITLADPFWRGLGGAIISGLLLASVIMLFFIPAVYYSWFKGENKN